MANTPFSKGPRRRPVASEQDGRNPPLGSLPKEGFTRINGLRESTKYGYLLYFLKEQGTWPLSYGQILWIVYRSRRLDLSELLRAGTVAEELSKNEETRNRAHRKLRELYFCVPSLDPKNIPEKRTIGIGYRDKGSLRPLHQQRTIGEEVFWDEDIAYLLPLDHEIVGRWITAEEVSSLVGIEQLVLATLQVQNQFLKASYPWKAE